MKPYYPSAERSSPLEQTAHYSVFKEQTKPVRPVESPRDGQINKCNLNPASSILEGRPNLRVVPLKVNRHGKTILWGVVKPEVSHWNPRGECCPWALSEENPGELPLSQSDQVGARMKLEQRV